MRIGRATSRCADSTSAGRGIAFRPRVFVLALALACPSARAAWTLERRGAGFSVPTDAMGHVPLVTVATETGASHASTREGFLRLPKPCGRSTLRLSVIAPAGAALIVDDAVVHRASLGGESLGAGKSERFSWRALPPSDDPRTLELDLDPPATCAVRVRLPGARVLLDRAQIEAIPANELAVANFQLDPLTLLPGLQAATDEPLFVRAPDRGDRYFLRWGLGFEVVVESPADARALLTQARDVDLRAIPEASRPLVRGTLALLRERLGELLGAPAPDPGLLRMFTEDLRRIVMPLAQGRDPLDTLEGAVRLGLLSPTDGRAQELAAYLPPLPRASARRYALVAALHGLDGRPMNFLRAVLGEHATGLTGVAAERLPQRNEPLDAFVVAPLAHGNAMYRGMGERAVLDALDAMVARFPIDRDRVTITGASMGGTGAAAIALRHPDRFAGAMPLCGYQSYFVRRDLTGATLHPWESYGAQLRSPALQAANGVGLALRVVHGTQDFPLENSKVLVDAFRRLGQPVVFDTPNAGHDVWTWTFTQGRGLEWLLAQRKTARKHVHHEGNDVTVAHTHAFRVEAPSDAGAWFELDAHDEKTRTRVTTKGIERLRIDTTLLDARAREVVVDATRLPLEKKRTSVILERRGGKWSRAKETPPKDDPILFRDLFQRPVQVYAAATPTARAVAETFVPHRPFQDVSFPLRPLASLGASTEGPTLLVGTMQDTHITEALRAEGIVLGRDDVIIGRKHVEGTSLGVALFLPAKGLAILAGQTEEALTRALALPDLLPTLVVFDSGVTADAHPVVGGRRRYLLAGQASSLLRKHAGR